MTRVKEMWIRLTTDLRVVCPRGDRGPEPGRVVAEGGRVEHGEGGRLGEGRAVRRPRGTRARRHDRVPRDLHRREAAAA